VVDQNTLVLFGVTLAALVVMLRPALLANGTWRATVTPLASIIGSGFLVVAPLLHGLAGRWSLVAITIIVLVAYSVGGVIRSNIRYESLTAAGTLTRRLEKVSSSILGVAYTISVAFYVALLVAFLLHALGMKTPETIRWSATGVLLVLASVGLSRGLHGYESLEALSVSVKLSIIAGILAFLVFFGITNEVHYFEHQAISGGTMLHRAQILGGLLMIAQGFETSRYLGHAYDAGTRVRTMRNAQLLSSGIYIAFIGLSCPLFFLFPLDHFDETGVSLVLGNVVMLAPILLLIAAVASQFSAAIADIVGASGLLRETIGRSMTVKLGYVVVTGVSLLLIWTMNIFEIITWASRGFAAYYALQTMLLLAVLWHDHAASNRSIRIAGLVFLLPVLLFVVFASIPPD
jgi:hypothetical protein